jgi:hypothetical protein
MTSKWKKESGCQISSLQRKKKLDLNLCIHVVTDTQQRQYLE